MGNSHDASKQIRVPPSATKLLRLETPVGVMPPVNSSVYVADAFPSIISRARWEGRMIVSNFEERTPRRISASLKDSYGIWNVSKIKRVQPSSGLAVQLLYNPIRTVCFKGLRIGDSSSTLGGNARSFLTSFGSRINARRLSVSFS